MSIISKWLTTEFRSIKTRATYRAGINKFVSMMSDIKKPHVKRTTRERREQEQMIYKKQVNQWINDYLARAPNVLGDIKWFIGELSNQNTPYKTIHTYVAAVKLFMEDHDHTIYEDEWRKIKKRLLPPSTEWSMDRAPTRKELLDILTYLDIKGRSVVYFLLSTGCRIGATLQLEIADIKLDSDPPTATMRGPITKYSQSQRIVPFSYQTRDAIKSWLAIRDGLRKTRGGVFSGPRIWNISYSSFYNMWNRALKKAKLVGKDKITGRKEIHIHCLRKWFFSNANLNEILKRGIMGQRQYLDRSYLRTDIERVKQEYLGAMDSVTIHSATHSPSGMSQLKQMAKRLGIPQEEIDEGVADNFFKQEVEVEEGVTEPSEGGMDLTELAEVLFPDIYEEVLRKLITRKKDGNDQMVIDQNELENHLSHGWNFVASIENNKCIVKQN